MPQCARPAQEEIAALWGKQELPEDDEDMAAEMRRIGGAIPLDSLRFPWIPCMCVGFPLGR